MRFSEASATWNKLPSSDRAKLLRVARVASHLDALCYFPWEEIPVFVQDQLYNVSWTQVLGIHSEAHSPANPCSPRCTGWTGKQLGAQRTELLS